MFAIANMTDATFVAYVHRCFGSPAISSFLKAIDLGYLRTYPLLTSKIVRKNLPLTPSTAFGHLDLARKNYHSTRKADPPDNLAGTLIDEPDCNYPNTFTVPRTEWASVDLTGRMTPRSRRGNEYVFVTVYRGYIHAQPMPSRTAVQYVAAHTRMLNYFNNIGVKFTHMTIDNEKSEDLDTLFKLHDLTVQFQPPGNHRSNFAERAIRTYKNHLIAILSGVHTHFPLDLWDLLLDYASMTLNHLLPYKTDPTISAYHGIHGSPVDFRAHPLHPPGQLVVIHERSQDRLSWAQHGLRGYYLSPSLTHYRCHIIHVVRTGATRTSDTLAHFPNPLFHWAAPSAPTVAPLPEALRPDPRIDGSDLVGSYFNEPELGPCLIISTAPPVTLSAGSGNRAPGQRLPPGQHHLLRYSYANGATDVSSVTEVARWIKSYPYRPTPARIISDRALAESRRLAHASTLARTAARAQRAALPRSAAPPPTAPTRRSPRLASAHLATSTGGPLPSRYPNTTHAPTSTGGAHPTQVTHKRPATVTRGLDPASDISTPVLNLDPHGKPLVWSTAKSGPDSHDWLLKDIAELIKLILETKTLRPVMNPLKTPTYYNRVVKEKWNKVLGCIERRVRGTAGGDRIFVDYDVSSSTASLTTLKILLNACLSENANFATIDLTDFYLGSLLPDLEYIKIYVDDYPAETLLNLGLTNFVQYDKSNKKFVYCAIQKTMYGLAMSGKLCKLDLVALLKSFGFHETQTPCLFRHATRNITFCLVVDDFGIKYDTQEDLEYLVSCLSSKYHVKVHPVGTKYLGFTIDYNRTARTLSMSYPRYIPDLLARLRPSGIKHYHSPAIYTPPSYGRTGPQLSTQAPFSPPASPAQQKELQIIVGSLLYYARAVDATILPAVCALACDQAAPTLDTMVAAERLLGYVAKFPLATITFFPSDMLLLAHSDASYLSRTNSGSVAGGFHFLGKENDPTFFNGPIFCVSTLIPVIVAAVSEAEYAAVFGNAQYACDERCILASLGYTQPPTTILCDNECAVGLANDTIRPKMSKSINMRLHWVQNRVKLNQFRVVFVPGVDNLADFFTKPLPVYRHHELTPYYITRPP
jgi:hypothetical protein